MKKEYISPKTLACEETEDFCLKATSNFADDQDAGAHGRKDNWDDEDLW